MQVFLSGTLELIISLILIAIISLYCGKSLKKNSTIWYSISWIVAVGTLVFGVAMQMRFLVIWAGALTKGYYIQKKLMKVRAELSILGTILYLPHALFYAVLGVPKAIKLLLEGTA